MTPDGHVECGEEGAEDRQQDGQQQHANDKEQAHRVAQIQGEPQAKAFWDNQVGIIWIIVKDATKPVAIVIAVDWAWALATSGSARSSPVALQRQEQDKRGGDDHANDQQKREHIGTHGRSSSMVALVTVTVPCFERAYAGALSPRHGPRTHRCLPLACYPRFVMEPFAAALWRRWRRDDTMQKPSCAG